MKNWVYEYYILEIITTGPDPQTALPVEAAALRVHDGAEVDSLATLIDPGVPVPASLLERNGRAQSDYREGLPATEALSRIRDFMEGGTALAHEAATMEAVLLERFQARHPGPLLDSQELAWLSAPYLRDHSLPSLASSMLGETPNWNAQDDARLLLRILSKLSRAWDENSPHTRGALLGALEEAQSPWCFFLPGKRDGRVFPDLADTVTAPAPAPAGGKKASCPDDGSAEKTGWVGQKEVSSLLGPHGPLADLYPDHEARPQQVAMAQAVTSAINDAAFLVVEAGTGVGKSLAYLVPGILRLGDGKGPLLVSTYTRNLQEQLFHRDLPLLARALGSLEFSLLKGRGNYLCLRRWSDWCRSLREEDPALSFGEIHPALAYAFLASWISHTPSGDLEEISLNLRGKLPGLLTDLASSEEDCLRPNCRLQSRCWVEKARCLAARSQVVVINHALLLSQIQASPDGPRNLILPDCRHLVVDEAHHLEDVATEALTFTFSLRDCSRMLEDIAGHKGILSRCSRLSLDSDGLEMISEAYRICEEAGSETESLFVHCIQPLLPRPQRRTAAEESIRYRLTRNVLSEPSWEKVFEKALMLAQRFSALSNLLAGLADKAITLRGGDMREKAQKDARRAEGLAGRAACSAAALEVFARDPEGESFQAHLRWVEHDPGKARTVPALRIKSAPASVAEDLSFLLFSRLDSAILTSASLRATAERGGFGFFLRRTGLDLAEGEGRELRLLALDSPFDYRHQVRLIAVTDLPDPALARSGLRRYLGEISQALEDILLATAGKALVLLTSHQQVEFLYSELRPHLERRGLCCLRQVKGLPNALLLERFRMDRDSVLFATEAFWEGVDVPGESLSAVIVVKLPFRHPEDPVVTGRMELENTLSGGGWSSYYLPLAVTLFRQGIGRLVRRSTDQGVIVVLDPRFLNRPYSSSFHAGLPPGLRLETLARHELASRVRRCFAELPPQPAEDAK
jgi:ATP-dependent DNA helicase DinG